MNFPYFNFYVNDWLSSPKIATMTPAQEGAYIRLLAYDWANDGIPDNDEDLSVLSRLGEGWFNGGSTVVKRCFDLHPTKDGFLTNKKLLFEREKACKWVEKSKEGGRRSAETRASRKGGSRVVQPPYQPKVNQSMSMSMSMSNTKSNENEVLTPLEESIQSFIKYRKEIKEKMTDNAIALFRKNIQKLANTDEEKIRIIETSIINGWKGVFPLDKRLKEKPHNGGLNPL